jgi:putative phosphoesterase
MTTIGVISDTHGLLRPEAVAALQGVSQIWHAGDIGTPEVLTQLSAIAPVTAVRGNNDRAPWAREIPETAVIELAGRLIYLLHDLSELDLDPSAAGISLVIHGHTHRPSWLEKHDVSYLNPGSAGPRRFSLPITLAKLHVGTTLEVEIVSVG